MSVRFWGSCSNREIDQSTILRSASIIQLFSFIHLFSERITIEIEDQSSCGQKNGLIIQLIGFSALMILMLWQLSPSNFQAPENTLLINNDGDEWKDEHVTNDEARTASFLVETWPITGTVFLLSLLFEYHYFYKLRL